MWINLIKNVNEKMCWWLFVFSFESSFYILFYFLAIFLTRKSMQDHIKIRALH